MTQTARRSRIEGTLHRASPLSATQINRDAGDAPGDMPVDGQPAANLVISLPFSSQEPSSPFR